MNQNESPARQLSGSSLQGGWRVLDPCPNGDPEAAEFSCCYHAVREDGTPGFLKALDFTRAVFDPNRDWLDQFSEYLNAYRYERDLHLRCNDRRLSRVITVLSYGEVQIGGGAPGPYSRVPYLIFELAEGDVRQRLEQMRDLDSAWALRVLQHTTTGLKQLHQMQVAHRDLKAGNVLTQKQGEEMVLGDLGCAVQIGASVWHESEDTPGTRSYAAPEQLYRGAAKDWEMRRAADLYQLGCFAVFLFTNRSLTGMIREFLPKELIWGRWSGGDYQAVLPYVRSAFAEAVDEAKREIERKLGRPDLTGDLIQAIQELCDPDPLLRGKPKLRNRSVSQYLLEPYESLFNRLAWHARHGRPRVSERQ